MDPATRFARSVDGSGEQLALDEMAALIGVAFEPGAAFDAVDERLDDLAARCDPTFSGIVDVLFGSGLLRGNTEAYDDPRNSYVHHVLDRGVGIPISLSVVAMGVGRRLGCPIFGVGNPGHFLIGDPATRRVVDPFNGGVTVSAPPWAPQPDRMILIRMLNNLKAIHLTAGEPAALYTLARLRAPFAELAVEQGEWRRWVRHCN